MKRTALVTGASRGIGASIAMRLAREGFYVLVNYHRGDAGNFHVIASQSNCPLVEYFPDVEPDTGNELFWKVFTGEPTAVDGYLIPSDRPGLGIEVNRDAVEKLRWSP